MLKDTVSVKDVIDLLNEVLEIDQDAMESLIMTRVACNEALADHPTIQVKAFKGEGFEVGILGILNGVFGIADDGFGRIAAVYDTDSKRLTSFKQIR